jgi:hypothetical protein
LSTGKEPPAALHEHAADHLRYIRDTMARATAFTAVPGWGGVWMGGTALLAAALSGPPASGRWWLGVWLTDAVAASGIGGVTLLRKMRRSGLPPAGPAGRRFALAFVPGLAAGAMLTAAIARAGRIDLLPGCWLLTYGAAVASAGAASVPLVPVMGVLMMAMGGAALASPASWGHLFMAAGFGGLHIAFGVVIARRYGG